MVLWRSEGEVTEGSAAWVNFDAGMDFSPKQHTAYDHRWHPKFVSKTSSNHLSGFSSQQILPKASYVTVRMKDGFRPVYG